jgi:hypothetical protein
MNYNRGMLIRLQQASGSETASKVCGRRAQEKRPMRPAGIRDSLLQREAMSRNAGDAHPLEDRGLSVL